MNNEREMLELAAKAAGIDPRRLPHAWPNRFDENQWNPLQDDGDALRLAVTLGLVPMLPCDYEPEQFKADPYAATRLAIVRAAVEIGRGMP